MWAMRAFWRSKAAFLGVAVLAVILMASQATGEPASKVESAKDKRVSIKDDLFSPRSVSVSRGRKVVWRWTGVNDHNVRFRKVPRGASKRGSPTQSSGRFARTFDKRGTYRYVCTIHEALGMRGSVNVD
jgi:plastocyanin